MSEFSEHYKKLCEIVQGHSAMIGLLNESLYVLNEKTMAFIKETIKVDKELVKLLKKEQKE